MFYATYDQHFPSESEERAGYWVGFGEHCGDAMTHKILDQDTQIIIYRSAVRPKKPCTPNHRLAPHGGEVSTSSDPSEDKISSGSPLGAPEASSPEQKTPTVFIRSRDEENPSGSKPMPTFDPSDLIGRTFLLPPEENGERHRANVTRKVVEIIDQGDGKLTYHLGADYFEDPDGTFVSQPKKYIDKLADTYKRLLKIHQKAIKLYLTRMITQS